MNCKASGWTIQPATMLQLGKTGRIYLVCPECGQRWQYRIKSLTGTREPRVIIPNHKQKGATE
jgi:hypothetical protein